PPPTPASDNNAPATHPGTARYDWRNPHSPSSATPARPRERPPHARPTGIDPPPRPKSPLVPAPEADRGHTAAPPRPQPSPRLLRGARHEHPPPPVVSTAMASQASRSACSHQDDHPRRCRAQEEGVLEIVLIAVTSLA